MDASTFRWVLVVIAVVAVIFIYLYGRHQSKLRRRAAVDSFTREEIESAFIEDEELRDELENLNRILVETDDEPELDQIEIKPKPDFESTPFALPDPEMFLPPVCDEDGDGICYLLRHTDFRLITGEEIGQAIQQADLQVDAQGYLEYRQDGQLAFRVCSLSPPGTLHNCDDLEFSTLGLVCFIDPDNIENPRAAYETLLKKVDELVRALDVKVYKSNQDLLTIADVTDSRQRLSGSDA